MYSNNHRVWAQVNLDNLVHNYKTIQACVKASEVACVIKADAYGHGAPQVARALCGAGAKRFAVATPEEALQLRRHGIEQPILLLGVAAPGRVLEMNENNIILTVASKGHAAAYAAVLQGKKQAIHVKINTGMNRLGVDAAQAASEILDITAYPCFALEGVFTHLAAADVVGEDEFTACQIAALIEITNQLKHRGVHIPLVHCANSAGIIAHPEAYLDMVRPGIMMYGSNPCAQVPVDLRPVMQVQAAIVQLHHVKKGESVSYGRTWYAGRDTVVATVAAGYADGLQRGLSSKMEMLVRGRRVAQIGRICMDMCMVDVTDVPGVAQGDIATIIGRDGGQQITADDVAALAGTISYEILCGIGRRVPRMYTGQGQAEEEICYVDKL